MGRPPRPTVSFPSCFHSGPATLLVEGRSRRACGPRISWPKPAQRTRLTHFGHALTARYGEGEGRPSWPRQRFYNLLCLVYGSDPVCYATLEPTAIHRALATDQVSL